jgi:hypothetical protein
LEEDKELYLEGNMEIYLEGDGEMYRGVAEGWEIGDRGVAESLDCSDKNWSRVTPSAGFLMKIVLEEEMGEDMKRGEELSRRCT